MSATWLGFWIILACGLLILLAAALVDRRNLLRGRTGATSGPTGDPDPARPDYLSPAQIARQASPVGTLGPAEAEALDAELAGCPVLPIGLLDTRFSTHLTGSGDQPERAVLPGALIASCPEPVEQVRELLALIAAGTPQDRLLIVAPAFAEEVIETALANLLSGRRSLFLARGDQQALGQLAGLTGGEPIPRRDLRSGWVPPASLGHCALAVLTPRTLTVRPLGTAPSTNVGSVSKC